MARPNIEGTEMPDARRARGVGPHELHTRPGPRPDTLTWTDPEGSTDRYEGATHDDQSTTETQETTTGTTPPASAPTAHPPLAKFPRKNGAQRSVQCR